MKVLLRQTKSRMFFAASREWTPDPGRALDFEEIECAIRHSREASMTGIEVVLHYDDPECDLVLPIGAMRS